MIVFSDLALFCQNESAAGAAARFVVHLRGR
jgi:hypothetical protein